MTKSKAKQPKKVKGALLIMVLTVMFVLIFLLAGTIAVVYSANNRVMNQYMESQAYYTARSVLDTYIGSLLKDNKNASSIGGGSGKRWYYIDKSSGSAVLKNNVAKQGRALELDLYQLGVDMSTDTGFQREPVNDSDFPDWAKAMLVARILNKDAVDKDTLLNPGHGCAGASASDPYSKQLETVRNQLKMSTDPDIHYDYWRAVIIDAANPNQDSFKHNNTNYGSYSPATPDPQDYASFNGFYDQFKAETSAADSDVTYYIIPSGTFSSYGDSVSGDSFGKVVDTATQIQDLAGKPANYPDAVIKVQMLERNYHIEPADNVDFKTMFDGGVRPKDYVKVKVTATVYFDGQPTTTSIVYKTKYEPTPSDDNALTSLGGIGLSSSQFSVDGGMSSLDPNGTIGFDAGGASGSIWTAGHLETTSSLSSALTLGNGDSWVVLGNFIPRNDLKLKTVGPNSFIYIGGKIDGSQNKLGNNLNGFDLAWIVNKFEQPNNGSDGKMGKVFANVYCLKNNNNCTTSGVWTNTLALGQIDPWSGTVSNAYGSCSWDGTTWTVNYNGNAVSDHSTITVAQYVILPGMRGSLNTTYSNAYDTKYLSDLTAREAYLTQFGFDPANDALLDAADVTFNCSVVSPNVTYAVDTSKPVKIDYHDPADYTLTDKKKKMFTMPDGNSYEVDTPQSRYGNYYDVSAFVDATPDAGYNGDLTGDPSTLTGSIVSAESKAAAQGAIDNDCHLSGSTITSGATLTAGNYIWPGSASNFTIDTSSGDVKVQMVPGSTYQGTVNVTGSGHVYFMFPYGNYDMGSSGNGLRIIYENTHNEIISGGTPTINVKNAGNLTPTPEIDYFVAAGSTVKFHEGGGTKDLIYGYLYAPAASVQVDTNLNGGYGTSTNYNDGSAIVSRGRIFLVGSAVVGTYSSQNVGIAFVSRNTDTSVPGDVVFKWADVYYMRGE